MHTSYIFSAVKKEIKNYPCAVLKVCPVGVFSNMWEQSFHGGFRKTEIEVAGPAALAVHLPDNICRVKTPPGAATGVRHTGAAAVVYTRLFFNFTYGCRARISRSARRQMSGRDTCDGGTLRRLAAGGLSLQGEGWPRSCCWRYLLQAGHAIYQNDAVVSLHLCLGPCAQTSWWWISKVANKPGTTGR